jgi:hypothetical protein
MWFNIASAPTIGVKVSSDRPFFLSWPLERCPTWDGRQAVADVKATWFPIILLFTHLQHFFDRKKPPLRFFPPPYKEVSKIVCGESAETKKK